MTSESLKVLRVSCDVYPDVVGGLGIHVHEMSRFQAELGHEVTLLTSDHGDWGGTREERRHGYRVVRHREIFDPLDNGVCPGLLGSLYRIADDYDVVHAHSHLFFSSNLAALHSRLSDVPLVITNHGMMSQTAPAWIQQLYLPTIGRFTLSSAHRVLCYTESDKSRLKELGIDAEIRVVHNGVDCERFKPRQSSRSGLQVLFVGRLKPGKGVRDLLAGFESVAREIPEATLRIVGDGPLRDDILAWMRNQETHANVELEGYVDYDRMPGVYTESDVFVLPSLYEGLPRTLLEAMACGVPVVASDLDQLAPLVEGAGILIPRRNPPKLAEALVKLLSDCQLRRSLGATGRRRVQRHHSWTETVRKTTRVCHELAKR